MLFMGLFFFSLISCTKDAFDRNDVENRLSILKQNYGIQYCRTDVFSKEYYDDQFDKQTNQANVENNLNFLSSFLDFTCFNNI